MPEWMIYVVLVLFPMGTVFWLGQYRDMRRRTVANYPGAQPELFAAWQAANLRALKRVVILWGVMSGVNLLAYFAQIGVAGPGLLFLVVQFLIVREPNREAARLAREIGLTTKAVVYVKNPDRAARSGTPTVAAASAEAGAIPGGAPASDEDGKEEL